jgi:8-oxo-dGTP pyrophosphatase MutT (NUDIX family)
MTKVAQATSGSLKLAFGGVVICADGRVLLREPSNHYDGYVWTFPKGRPNSGESPETAALREVLEETGLAATIVSPISGEFPGGTTSNHYYLMEEADPGAPLLPHDSDETAAVRWATFKEAKVLIGMTSNPKGRLRDLKVLDAAYVKWKLR